MKVGATNKVPIGIQCSIMWCVLPSVVDAVNYYNIAASMSTARMNAPGLALTATDILDIIEDGNLSEIEGLESDEEDGCGEVTGVEGVDLPIIGEDRDNIPDTEREADVQFDVASDDEDEGGVIPEDDVYDLSNVTPKTNIQWRHRAFSADVDLPSYISAPPQPQASVIEPLSPIDYFDKYITDDLFNLMTEQTNLYAVQQMSRGYKVASINEMRTLVGLHLAMGVIKFPRIRMYWDTSMKIGLFQDSMSRDRFMQLRSRIHFANILERPADNKDVFYKVRPLYESLRKRCISLMREENLCVDEQMVPFRGTLSVKQYIKGKPHPWGVKIFMLCGQSGLVYNFIIYQGSKTELSEAHQKKFGQGAAVVLHLCKEFLGVNHKLYCDNYFTSYNLLEALNAKQIFAAGTVRVNRFAKPPLLSDKDMGKKQRGSHDEVTSRDGKIVLVKWFDNRPVVLASNFVGVGEEDVVERWDKTEKKYLPVKRPEVVKRYNASMGGVDKIDQLISLYRTYIKSRKWTLRMITHGFDVAVSNSWLEYKRDATNAGMKKKDILDLLHFRMRVAECLIRQSKPVLLPKRGRPSTSPVPHMEQPVAKRAIYEVRPCPEVQEDLVDHMPCFDDKKEASRCKRLQCKGKTHVYCDKCNIHLCFVPNRNCFRDAHRK